MSTEYNIDTTQTQSTSTSSGIGLDKDYIRTIPGILKIVECVLCLIAFICASAHLGFSVYGGGWVQFVTMSALIITLVLFFFHLFRIIVKLPGPWTLIEFIYYCVYTVFMLISFIVSAARAPLWYNNGAIIAAAIFTFLATSVFAVDTFFQFRNWQETRSSGGGPPAAATTTTTTHTTYETRTQY